MSHSASVVEYVTGCAYTMTVEEIAADLANLGKHGAEWPRASAIEWRRAIREAAEAGQLSIDDRGNVLKARPDQPRMQKTLF